jgi:predicted O-methyltransferase YrrM
LFNRIFRGNDLRRSRLHDEMGNFAGLNNIALHGPRAFVGAGLRVTFGLRPIVPWIAYSAIRRLSTFVQKGCRVLEFGSGNSTVWLAERAGLVCSVEHSRVWYEATRQKLAQRGLSNVEYVLVEDGGDQYCDFKADDVAGFDLIIVDGLHRSRCVERALRHLKPGGILYLDNSDRDPAGGDMRAAEQLVRAYARECRGRIDVFTDFSPAQFFVQQGLMLTVGGARG